jgi:hypothetical protein
MSMNTEDLPSEIQIRAGSNLTAVFQNHTLKLYAPSAENKPKSHSDLKQENPSIAKNAIITEKKPRLLASILTTTSE